MKVSDSLISFKRVLTPLEKIETRVYSQEAKKEIGLQDLAIVTHSLSFPSIKEEDIGIGLLSLNQGAKSYVDFLFDNAIDSLSIEPLGIIKPEEYSPYEGSLLSRKQIVDLKLLCSDKWANIFDMESYNEIVNNKNYIVQVQSEDDLSKKNEAEFSKNMVLYDYVMQTQKIATRKAYENFKTKIAQQDETVLALNQEFLKFKQENDFYLKSDSIYSVLSELYGVDEFVFWDNKLHQTLFDSSDLTYSKEEKEEEIKFIERQYFDEIEYYKFVQFVVNKQQKDFVKYASSLAKSRYEKDVEILKKAYEEGKISDEKYKYLILKLKELKEQKQGVNIVGDKQVSYSDMDIYLNPSFYTKDEFLGAPPNVIKGSTGQDWEFRFIPYDKMFNSDGSLAPGGLYLKKIMKKAFEDNPGGLRIDHIIGLIDPWSYTKINDDKIDAKKLNLFLLSRLSELKECGITSEKIFGLKDIIGAITGDNIEEHNHLIKKGDIDFERARKILNDKKDFLKQISKLDSPLGSRHIFKYLLENDLAELKKFGLNEKAISGIIDPVKGIFDEKSTERGFLIQRGIKDFEKIQEIFLSKKDKIGEIYSNIIEKIVLASASEVIEQDFINQGKKYTQEDVKKKAASMIMCEDLGALTIPVKEILKKNNLWGMRDAARSNPYDKNHIYREINPAQKGNYWLISTHDTASYKLTFLKYNDEMRKAHISYVADEMGVNKNELLGKENLWKYIKTKMARIFVADKNAKTPKKIMLNWLDIFAIDNQYNTPGLHDKTKNWVLRICGSDEDFEKKYYEQILPSQKGINIPETLNLAMTICEDNQNNIELKKELNRLSKIAQE